MFDYLTQAYEFGQQGNYRPAIALLDQLLQDEPDHVDALYLRGLAYYHLKDFEAARRDWDAALAVAPGCQPVREAIEYLIDRGRDPVWLQSVYKPESSLAEPPPFPVQDSRPLLRQKLFDLFFRPTRFFAFNSPSYTNLQRWGLMWLLGVSAAIVIGGNPGGIGLYFLAIPTWLLVVATFFIFALLHGGVAYLFWGWWFCLRLRFCGVKQIDSLQGRDLYLTVKLIQVIPLLGVVLLGYVFLGGIKPFYFWLRWHWGWKFVLVAILGIWSCYTAYRGVRIYARAPKQLSRLWFMLVPGVFYTCFIVYHLSLQYTLSNSIPDISHTISAEFHSVRFSYPGNWGFYSTDEDVEWMDDESLDAFLKSSFEETVEVSGANDESSIEETDEPFFCWVESNFLDMYVDISIWNHESDLDEIIEENIPESDGDAIKVSRYRETFDRWGVYDGKGIIYNCVEDDVEYCHRIFAANVDNRSFLILEVCCFDDSDLSDTAFNVIRRSFEVGNDTETKEEL